MRDLNQPVRRRTFVAGLAAGAAGSWLAPGTARGAEAGAEAGRPVRIAQIGTGHSHAEGKLEAIRELPELFEVAGWAEADPDLRRAAEGRAAFAGLPVLDEEAVLADGTIGVVVVETGSDEATGVALRAIRAGKHVHLDKPGGFRHEAFAAMRGEAEERGRIVQMGYMLRENPAIALLFRAAREGWFGTVLEVDAHMGKLAGAELRRELADYPGHGMFELGCHLVDAVVTILGAPDAVHPAAAATRAPDDTLPDNQLAVLQCGGALATLRCNHADRYGDARRKLSVVGTMGRATVAPLESGKLTLELAEPQGEFAAGRHELTLPNPHGRYGGEFRTLARCIAGETAYGWSAAHDIAVHAAALRAAGVEVA